MRIKIENVTEARLDLIEDVAGLAGLANAVSLEDPHAVIEFVHTPENRDAVDLMIGRLVRYGFRVYMEP